MTGNLSVEDRKDLMHKSLSSSESRMKEVWGNIQVLLGETYNDLAGFIT